MLVEKGIPVAKKIPAAWVIVEGLRRSLRPCTDWVRPRLAKFYKSCLIHRPTRRFARCWVFSLRKGGAITPIDKRASGICIDLRLQVESARQSALKNVLTTFFAGSTSSAVAALLDASDDISDAELGDIKRLIDERRKQNRKEGAS